MLTVVCNLKCQVTPFAFLEGCIFSVMKHSGKTHKMKVKSSSISSRFPVALFSWRDWYLARLVHRHLSISVKVRHLLITHLHDTFTWHGSETPLLSNLVTSVVKRSELILCLCLRILKNVVCSDLEQTMTLIFQLNVAHRASLLQHCRCRGLRARNWGRL